MLPTRHYSAHFSEIVCSPPKLGRKGDRLAAHRHYASKPGMVLVTGRGLFGIDLSDQELVRSMGYVSSGLELRDYSFWYELPTG